MNISRQQVLAYRIGVQQLDREGRHDLTDAAVLDLGVQDTGPDGAAWALVNRGVDPAQVEEPTSLVLAWTLRGAPHFYRRSEVAGVAAATAPFSEADAAKRVFDAATPLRAAGIGVRDALHEVGDHMRAIVTKPMVKGEMSTRLTTTLDAPYLRHCRPCDAVHSHEQTFRLAALPAGLELQPGTSPPVVQRITRWRGPAARVPTTLDVVRGYLHLLGPATPKLVAGYLDAPVTEVRNRWPDDTVEVAVDGERRWILEADETTLRSARPRRGVVRLLSPFDLFLQARDRELLVPDAARRKQLWVVLGRPGAVLVRGEIVGLWRPRASGGKLRLAVTTWEPVPEKSIHAQAERLAVHRGMTFAGFTAS